MFINGISDVQTGMIIFVNKKINAVRLCLNAWKLKKTLQFVAVCPVNQIINETHIDKKDQV
jgi:hypothetical protein